MTATLKPADDITDAEVIADRPPSEGSESTAIELAALLGIVVIADLTIYRGHGFAGLAFFFAVVTGLFALGTGHRPHHRSFWLIGGLLSLLVMRLTWHGSVLLVVVGFVGLAAFVAARHGRPPHALAVFSLAAQSVIAGVRTLWQYQDDLRRIGPDIQRRRNLAFALPAAAFLAFSTLFVLANPDVVSFVGRHFRSLLNNFSDWFVELALRPTEILFWLAVSLITAGLLRPLVFLPPSVLGASDSGKTAKSSMYPAFRNTLVTVIALFAVYLIYELYTMWTRDFPEGFYYAGYAHQGAAWLTVALALATLTLSLVFCRQIRSDPRLPTLRRLAWVWSTQNLLLSLAVYNRLFIYIDFNGMTRMRVVGLFGISLVVVGFGLVVFKIARSRSFSWLIQRQVWAFVLAVYIFALLPIDAIAVSDNVRRIKQGKLSACMQIGVQPLDLEGTLALIPLLDAPTPEIREGVAALIAAEQLAVRSQVKERQELGWTAYQASGKHALERFERVRPQWEPFEDAERRAAAIKQFYDFAYQWY